MINFTKDTFDIVTLLTNINFLIFVVFIVMSVATLVTLWIWHHDESSPFDLKQVLMDNTTNKIAIEKVGFMTALLFGSFGFIALLLMDKLTEWYAGIYMGYFAAARFGSSWLSVKKEIPEPPKPD
jgi:phosphoglycerol transferase MdoB-like AlkP superfamily enzyme